MNEKTSIYNNKSLHAKNGGLGKASLGPTIDRTQAGSDRTTTNRSPRNTERARECLGFQTSCSTLAVSNGGASEARRVHRPSETHPPPLRFKRFWSYLANTFELIVVSD